MNTISKGEYVSCVCGERLFVRFGGFTLCKCGAVAQWNQVGSWLQPVIVKPSKLKATCLTPKEKHARL